MMKGVSTGTVTFERLPEGVYYVFETDRYGNVVPYNEEQETDGINWQYQLVEGSSEKVEFSAEIQGKEGTVGLYNLYYSLPDGYEIKAEIEISKKVIIEGKEQAVDEKFYAGIFANETDTKPLYNVELVQNDSVKTQVVLGGKNGDELITYYVFETDAFGNKVGEGFSYMVEGEGAVTLDKENTLGKVELINKIETKTTEKQKEDKPTRSSKTGDESNITFYLALMIMAFIVACGSIVYKKRRL